MPVFVQCPIWVGWVPPLTFFLKPCFPLLLFCLALLLSAALMPTLVWGLVPRGIVKDLLDLGHLHYLFVLMTIIQ